MNNKFEYLIKYSVGSPPSRDYYSLKVLQDEVILHLWRISHGPHKAPIIHSVKFAEFGQEKSLQDKIRHGFGEHLLNYVKNITEGNLNTLLTLPKPLIEKITSYLKFTDIVKLSSLSHVAYEIFNADSVWQILYERDKETRVSLEERQKAKVYGWKHLYKDRQIQMSLKNKKDLRIQSSTKFANDLKINKSSSRLTSGALKAVSKTVSTNNVTAKKHSESSSTDLVTIPLSKTTSDIRFRANTKNEKLLPKRRNVKNAEFNINERNIQKEDLISSKMRIKPETKSISNNKCDESIDKQHDKLEKHKTNNINAKLQRSKSKPVAPKTHSLSKNTIKNTKSSSNLAQNSHNKTRSKTKTKPEKAATTKCEIFNTAEELSNKPFIVGDGNFDLADLIEASLKNIRSPRSIFNYDFNYMQQSDATKDASRINNKIINVDKLQQLKPSRSDFNTNDFSNRMTRGGTLEKLSEKSESFSGSESSESLIHNEKLSSGKDNKTLSLSDKYIKAREELRKSLNWNRSNSTFSETR